MNDEDQELESHLRKRHASARRLSTIALATQHMQQHQHKSSVDSTHSHAVASTAHLSPQTAEAPLLLRDENGPPVRKISSREWGEKRDRRAVLPLELKIFQPLPRLPNNCSGYRLGTGQGCR